MLKRAILPLPLLILSISLLLYACSPSTPIVSDAPTEPPPSPTQGPIELTDSLGQTISLAAPAQRIISLAPSNTEILFAIGAGSQVIGRDSYSDYPSEAQAITEIGGAYGDINVETIVSLTPDLVLAANLTPPEQVEALKELGLTVFALGNPTDFEGLYINLHIVATLTGHQDEAAAMIEELEARVTAVREKVATVTERPLVFYELDGSEPDAPWTAGPGTFIATLIDMAGGKNLGSALDSEWAQVSAEELIAQNPDVIILGDYTWGGVTPEDVGARAGWEVIEAVKTGKVHVFNDNLVSRPGPRLVDGLEDMVKLLHPELFQ